MSKTTTVRSSAQKVEDIDLRERGPRVAVCAITYMRPDGLRRMLEGIETQKAKEVERNNIVVVVVDNDPAGSGRETCEQFASSTDLEVVYEIETDRGIPSARNRSVMLAKGRSDFVAILDDDEVPEPAWLDELVKAQKQTGADVLTGPVQSHFVEPPPAWAVDGKFYDKAGPKNLDDISGNYGHVYTSNMFAKTELFDLVKFDNKFKLTGSSDTRLFMQMHELGLKVNWADRALVTEWNAPSRVAVKWLFQRAYRKGNGFARCEAFTHPSLKQRLSRVAKGVLHCLVGAAKTVTSFGRKVQAIKALQQLAMGAGMVTASFGSTYNEYKTTHTV